MKKLRKKYGANIRFFHCGEYGGQFGRPHYHTLLFNHDFLDKELFMVRDGNRVYKSEELDKLWGKGITELGDVTFESAGYVARYNVTKLKGECTRVMQDEVTGEWWPVAHEYGTQSNGIGKDWFEKYSGDVYPSDDVVIRGVKMQPPKYYDELLAENDPELLAHLKSQRARARAKVADDNTSRRHGVRERYRERVTETLRRNLQ